MCHVLTAGVVHQAVNAAVLGHDGSHAGLHGVFIADIAHMLADFATVLGDLDCSFLQLFGLAAYERYGGAQGCQLMGCAAANAGAASGNHHHFAGKQAGREDRTVMHHTS
jgi:hypothetical protein